MVVEEQEAGKYLCPMKVGKASDVGNMQCEGAKCMAWCQELKEVPGSSAGFIPKPSYETTSRGYCGLAYR